MPTVVRLVTIFLILLSSHVHVAAAQVSTADILGRVADNTGAVLPGATVSAENAATGVVRTTVTGATGDYLFTLLPIGTYMVSIELQGFQTHTARAVLASGDRARVDARLELTGVAETVTVQAEAPLVQTDSATVSTLLPEQAVQDLPVIGRNFVRLLALVPGGNEGTGNSFIGGNRPDEKRQTNSFSINGALDNQNNVLIDGFDNNERQIGSIGVKPSLDAIAEIRVQTNLYTAEVGRTSGGVVNIITQSGTNLFHGSAFEFARNDRFDARNLFAREKPSFRQHQYGGSLGGPIQRNRLFFFADYEGFTQDRGIPYVITVPTERMRRGDFSELSTVIYDPTTSPRLPFSGNVIPADRLDPIGQRIANLYPLPNAPGLTNNYLTNSLRTQDSHTADLRIDHQTSAGSMFARYSMNDVETYEPTACEIAGASIQPGCAASNGQFPGTNTTTAHALHASYASILGPTLVAEGRVGYSKLDIETYPPNFGTNAAEQLGFRNLNVDELSSALPVFTVSGYSPLGDFRFIPLLNLSDTWQLHGLVTKTTGSHTVKVGGGAILRDYSVIQSQWPQGMFTFNERVTTGPTGRGGDAIASMLLGVPSSAGLNRMNFDPHYYTNEPYAYVNDDWRVTSNVSLNLGVRYDVFTPIAEAGGNMSNLDPATGRLLIAGQEGTSQSAGVRTDYGNIAPRLGIAATLPGRLVLRGGYGLTYFPGIFRSQSLLKNPPFVSAYGPVLNDAESGGLPSIFLSTPFPPPVPTDHVNPSGSLIRVDFDAGTTRVQQFNVIVEKQIGAMVASAAYVGSRGDREAQTVSENLAPPGPGPVQPRRPYADLLPQVSTVTAWRTIFESSYDGLQLGLRQRLVNGLTFNTHYTLGDAMRTESSPNDPSVIERFPNDADVRHRWVLTVNYLLPFGESLDGIANHLLAGWQVNAVAFWQTGFPIDVNNTSNRANTGGPTSDGIPPSGPGDRPNMVCDPTLPAGERTIDRWFNTDCFQAQPLNTIGNAPRRPFHGPSHRQLDLSLFKDVAFGDTARLQFRIEAYNILNVVNFAAPNSQLGNRAFGTITSTGNSQPRQMQFGVKLLF